MTSTTRERFEEKFDHKFLEFKQVLEFIESEKKLVIEEIVETMQNYADNLIRWGKSPSLLEIEEQIKYHSRKSDHKHHEVAGKLLAIHDLISKLKTSQEGIRETKQ